MEAHDGDAHGGPRRDDERSRLAADVEAFLRQGGKVEEVPRGFRADPPKKPESNYGRSAI